MWLCEREKATDRQTDIQRQRKRKTAFVCALICVVVGIIIWHLIKLSYLIYLLLAAIQCSQEKIQRTLMHVNYIAVTMQRDI